MNTVRFASVVVCLALAACGGHTSVPVPGARADFVDATGNPVGEAVLFQRGDGVLITTAMHNLPAGAHGFHVHSVGKCEPPFQTAGAHFNPLNKLHGFENPQGPHLGDLRNLSPGSDGMAHVDVTAANLRLDQLFDADGSALVIHAAADDYKTDPSGNSGARIICGVIRKP
jgi:superoxide dismutase, Cu-Zn family